MSVCDHCGELNAEAARFCSACGAELPERVREGLEVRKTVTVLFCDVVGSTALGEAADPETTRRVMARYAQEMAEVVEAHGGTVERFRGDEVMAVFGVPVVHEDDALRAVRAGMAMQARLAVLNEELTETWGVALACRIGINTGEVVAGDPGTGSTFVTGDAVNLGKRLEQAASPGEILIGTATYPLVKDAVRVGPRERFSAKGKRGPVERFRLDEVDADAAGIARRLDAPLVGRNEELQRLQGTVEAALDDGRCTVLSIAGPAGIGKSRLAREVTIRLGARARIASGRCLPYGSGITYWPLVELVHDLGGLDELAERLGDAPEAIASVRTAVSQSESVASNDEVFWGVRRILEAVASERPLVVCLDDLHWAEPTMLDLVDYLAAFARGPIALLCTTRPELLDRRPGWAMHPLFELGHLTSAETGELVEHLGVEDRVVRERIADTAEGNPLFAEQLAAMVMETGVGAGDALALPASIHALIAARLDTLDAAERRVLERASVVGKEFWWSAVADLSGEADRPHIGGRLLALTRKGLIRPVGTEGRGEHAFSFRHALIRDTAYTAMPKALRTDLHEAFADWLEAQTARGFGEHPEIVGYHAEQAFRLRSELGLRDDRTRELGERAAMLLRTAGHQAFARDDMPAAASLIERALGLTSPADRVELEFELSGALWSVGDRERADALLESVATMGDERLRWHALLERAAWRDLAHEAAPNSLLDTARRAQEYFEKVGDDVGLARAWRRIAFVQLREGAFGTAAEASERALRHAAQAGDARERGRIVDGLCSALLYGPTPAPVAIERCEQLLEGSDSQPSLTAAVYSSLAGLLAMRERFDDARNVYARAKRLWEELGLRYAVAGLTQIGAEVELLAGDPVAAERELLIGEEIFAGVGGSPVQSALLGKALLAQERLDEAERQAVEARDRAGEEVSAEVVGDTVASVVAMWGGRSDDAIRLAQDAVRRARRMEAPNLQADALETLAGCFAATGRQVEATAARDEALRLYDAKGNLASARRIAGRVA